jgi:NADH:ubiquinone oxidoreductase subunit 3 (subunit A)
MSALYLTAVAYLGGALLLGLAALGLGRLLRPSRSHPSAAATRVAATHPRGAALHAWHLVALAALFQAVLVPLLVWGAAYGDLRRAGAPGALGLLAFLALVAVGLAHAWRGGLLDTGPPSPDVGEDDGTDG